MNLGIISIRHPKLTIHNCNILIKNKYQRMTRGWADYDAYNFNNWFLSVVPEMIKHMRENLHSRPVSVSIEEWENILTKMESSFRNADIDVAVESADSEDNLEDFVQDNLEDGMELLKVWFWELWD